MMKFLTAFAVLPLLLAGGCSKDGADNATAAAPVKAVAAPAGQDWTQVVAKTDQGYRMGNPDAPVTLVEYGSRLCPTCGLFAREGFQPLTNDFVKTGKVSFEFREFLVHGAPDLPPALLGNCVDKAAFFPLLEQMYQSQQQFDDKLQALTPAQQQALQSAKPTDAVMLLAEDEGIIPFVQQRGIPEQKARACLGDQAKIDALTKQTQDKTADGTVTGTPTFILNGKKIDAITWDGVKTALHNAGA